MLCQMKDRLMEFALLTKQTGQFVLIEMPFETKTLLTVLEIGLPETGHLTRISIAPERSLGIPTDHEIARHMMVHLME